jgi:hypothetical protein
MSELLLLEFIFNGLIDCVASSPKSLQPQHPSIPSRSLDLHVSAFFTRGIHGTLQAHTQSTHGTQLHTKN